MVAQDELHMAYIIYMYVYMHGGLATDEFLWPKIWICYLNINSYHYKSYNFHNIW